MGKSVIYHYGKFPPADIDWAKLVPLIGPANAALARYDGTLAAIPNSTVLLTPLTTQEAVLSSKIEGTQATMAEVLEYEAEGYQKGLPEKKKGDIQEVLNYRKAVWHCVDMLNKLPLCQRIIREAHKVLMQQVRGKDKAPGEYRRIQNWIGSDGTSLKEARFVPISPEKLSKGMDRWEKYIHNPAEDKLVQLAVLHAEFESLHPFIDGNGRVGRMFVPLFLCKLGLIQSPTFYISAYFDANRDEYYNRLLSVSRDNNWNDWCVFFLKAVETQAKENQKKASEILALYEKKKAEIQELTRSQYAIYALDFIFERPVFRSIDFARFDKIPEPSARSILLNLRNAGLLKSLQKSSGRRSAIYVFAELMNIAEGKTAF